MKIAASDAPRPPKKKRTAAGFSPNGPFIGAAPAVQHKGSGKR